MTTTTNDTGQQPDDQRTGHDGGEQTEESPARLEQRLRAERREAVEERDSLRGQVAALRRSEVLRQAAEHLADPSDLLDLAGVAVDDLLDEQGAIDAGRVREQCEALVKARGERFARPRSSTSYDGGVRQTVRKPERVGWGAVLNPDEHARTRGAR